jgi:hypothetical protein
MILALSGRRIDAADAEHARFPLQNVDRVSQAVRRLLVDQGVSWLVSSAACGADLIALSEAGQLGIRRRVVLPFAREKFREASVVDRPGEWGDLYDGIMDQLRSTGDILIVKGNDGEDPFRAACQEILDEAAALGKERRQTVGALMVWDGNVRNTPDYTSEFGTEAKARGMTVVEISTV